MKILPRILDRLNILCVRFTESGGVEVSVATYVYAKGRFVAQVELRPLADPGAEKNAFSKSPVVMVVSGKGIITKETTAGNIVGTVTSDPATFLWSVSENKISFVRREQLTEALDDLQTAGIRPLYEECLADFNARSLAAVAERFVSGHLGWRRIVKPTSEGSQLASLVAGRVMLPVLGVLLSVLAVNFAVSSRVETGFREANATLAAFRRTSLTEAETTGRRQAAIEEFSRGLPYSAARLSDMVASVVPEHVVLGELSIAPVTKTPENGKSLVQNENTLAVRGETGTSEAITEFTGALTKLRLGTVTLASVEQDREREALIFVIELTL